MESKMTPGQYTAQQAKTTPAPEKLEREIVAEVWTRMHQCGVFQTDDLSLDSIAFVKENCEIGVKLVLQTRPQVKKANAKTIAALPELIEASQGIIPCMLDWIRTTSFGEINERDRQALAKLREALRKAGIEV